MSNDYVVAILDGTRALYVTRDGLNGDARHAATYTHARALLVALRWRYGDNCMRGTFVRRKREAIRASRLDHIARLRRRARASLARIAERKAARKAARIAERKAARKAARDQIRAEYSGGLDTLSIAPEARAALYADGDTIGADIVAEALGAQASRGRA